MTWHLYFRLLEGLRLIRFIFVNCGCCICPSGHRHLLEASSRGFFLRQQTIFDLQALRLLADAFVGARLSNASVSHWSCEMYYRVCVSVCSCGKLFSEMITSDYRWIFVDVLPTSHANDAHVRCSWTITHNIKEAMSFFCYAIRSFAATCFRCFSSFCIEIVLHILMVFLGENLNCRELPTLSITIRLA